jgi:hypothetical protein
MILKSASKVVFIIMALTSCGGFLLGLLEAKDFMFLTGMAFSFYFTQKIPNIPEKPTT